MVTINTNKGPLNFRLGKEEVYTPMAVGGGKAHFGGPAQIFVSCKGQESPNCHKSISLHPMPHFTLTSNEVVDAVTNEQAANIFTAQGWQVFGYNGASNICPECLKIVIEF